MKIAIYQPRVSYYLGGGEVVPLEMAKKFVRHGHEVTIITSNRPNGISSYFKAYMKNNKDIKYDFLSLDKRLDWIFAGERGSDQLTWNTECIHFGRAAQEYFKDNDSYDILNVHYKVDVLAANPRIPTVMFLHGIPSDLAAFDPVWFSFPNVYYFSCSNYIGKWWKEKIPKMKFKVFTNGIDSVIFHPVHNTKKEIDILYLGRLVASKGLNYLIEAIHLLKEKGFAPRVVIGGEGPEKESLVQRVDNLGLASNVTFAGYVRQQDLIKMYNQAKVFVAPSFEREGILTTILEASACGVPVITTNSCSMPEFVEDGINGFLAEPKNSESLAGHIEELLINDIKRTKMGKKARLKAEAWDWEKKSRVLEKYYYEKIISK